MLFVALLRYKLIIKRDIVTGDSIRGQDVLITGGLGFLGSNLALRLVSLGARVTIVDSLDAACGGNPHNVAPVAGGIRVIGCDIGEAHRLRDVLQRSRIIFNLAGEISHSHSMRFPERDARLNAVAQLAFLTECARQSPGARIVYSGTRQIFGVPRYLPVDEDHPVSPVDFNGIHSYAAVMYHTLYARLGKLDAVVINLTNLYGPRMALSRPCQGFLGNFVRRLCTGKRLEVYGDGRQLRDPLYVDDAVEAILKAGTARRIVSRMYNAGGPEPLSIAEIAAIGSRMAGLDAPVLRPFPPEQKLIDIGSYYADNTRIGHDLGWSPRVKFESGLRRTLSFYEAELVHYLDSPDSEPSCRLDEPELACPRSAAG